MPEDIITRILKIPRQIVIFWGKVHYYGNQTISHFKQHWKKYTALAVVLYFIVKKDVSIDLQLTGPPGREAPASVFSGLREYFLTWAGPAPREAGNDDVIYSKDEVQPRNVSQVEGGNRKQWKIAAFLSSLWGSAEKDDNLANDFSNLSFSGSEFATSEDDLRRAEKIRKQKEYVQKYAGVARREMEEFNIPASITLAQGLLESNAGESTLSVKNNNHFGIKCFSRRCRKDHCSNFTDDHHKDFFRIYKSPEESYRAHSLLLQAKRYSPLFELKDSDYKGWAYGLKKAGYATDRHYAEKLIEIIEELELYRHDR